MNREYRKPLRSWDDDNDGVFSHLAWIGISEPKSWHCRGYLISDKHVITTYECVNDTSLDIVALGPIETAELFRIEKFFTHENTLTLITLDANVK